MSAAEVRDLVLVRDADRQKQEQFVGDTLKAWATAWIPAQAGWKPKLETACSTEQALDAGTLNWSAHGVAGIASGTARGWSSQPADAVARLAALLVERESTAPLADTDWALKAAASALRDLHVRMLGAAANAEITSSPDCRLLGGTVLVRERNLDLAWAWPVPAAASISKASAAAPATLAAVTQGVASQQVKLSAGLGEVEIELAELLALQIGDVIRFPTLLKGAVPVSIAQSAQTGPALQAKLGQREGHVALKLTVKSAA